MKQNNKGFSLLEVVVALAISSLVFICVSGFVSVGLRTSNTTKANSTVSQETQTTINQLNRMVMEATKAIYSYSSGEDTSFTALGADEVLMILNGGEDGANDYFHLIVWSKADYRLYYAKVEVTASLTEENVKSVVKTKAADYISNQMKADGKFKQINLMAEYVSEFTVDLSKINDSVATVEVTTSMNGRKNTSANNITLRNKLQFD